MNAPSVVIVSEEQLDTDVQRTISGAEEMLEQAAVTTGEKGVELRRRALQQLSALRERLQIAQSAMLEKSKLAARATDDYVHDHPWRVVLAAAGVGVLIGLLINRR